MKELFYFYGILYLAYVLYGFRKVATKKLEDEVNIENAIKPPNKRSYMKIFVQLTFVVWPIIGICNGGSFLHAFILLITIHLTPYIFIFIYGIMLGFNNQRDIIKDNSTVSQAESKVITMVKKFGIAWDIARVGVLFFILINHYFINPL